MTATFSSRRPGTPLEGSAHREPADLGRLSGHGSAPRCTLPSAVLGKTSTSTSSLGAAKAGSRSFATARSASSVGGREASRGTTKATTRWPHSGIGPPGHAHLGHSFGGRQHRLHRLGPHVLPAGDDEVAGPPVHHQAVPSPTPPTRPDRRSPANPARPWGRGRPGSSAAAWAPAGRSRRRDRCGPPRRRAVGRRRPPRCRSRSSRRWWSRWPAGRPAAGHRPARSAGTARGRSVRARSRPATRAWRPLSPRR